MSCVEMAFVHELSQGLKLKKKKLVANLRLVQKNYLRLVQKI